MYNDSVIRSIAIAAAQAVVNRLLPGHDSISVQTPDATPVIILVIEIPDNSSGVLQVVIVGADDTGAGSVRGSRILGFDKAAGALTLGTPVDILPLEDGLSGASYQIVDDGSGNIGIEATGVALVNWTVRTSIIQSIPTSLP